MENPFWQEVVDQVRSEYESKISDALHGSVVTEGEMFKVLGEAKALLRLGEILEGKIKELKQRIKDEDIVGG